MIPVFKHVLGMFSRIYHMEGAPIKEGSLIRINMVFGIFYDKVFLQQQLCYIALENVNI